MSAADLTVPLPTRLEAPGAAMWRERLRRLALPGVGVGALVALLLAIDGPGKAFADALGRVLDADPRWLVAALLLEVLSFAGYAVLLWHVAGREAARFDLRVSTQLTLAGTAASRALPTAGAGGAALTLWTLRRAGHRGHAGIRTLLTFLVLVYAVFLGSVLVAGALVATGLDAPDGPVALAAIPAALAGAGIAVALALGLRRPRTSAAAAPAGRLRTAATLLSEAVRDALGLLREGDPRLLGAPAWWGFDIAVLWATFQALGSPPPLAVLVLAYFLGQVANTLPLPGSVSGGTVAILLAFGGPAGVSLAAVLSYRAIAVWTPGIAGLAALAGLRFTLARWAAEDRALEPVPASARLPERPAWAAPEAMAA